MKKQKYNLIIIIIIKIKTKTKIKILLTCLIKSFSFHLNIFSILSLCLVQLFNCLINNEKINK